MTGRPGRVYLQRRPLFNRGIVVTRPRSQAVSLVEQLSAAGARVLEFPTIAVEPVVDNAELDQTLRVLHSYAWVLFTSANGVDIFFARLKDLGMNSCALGSSKVAAIGTATASALERWGVRADIVPAEYQAEGLLEALGGVELQGTRFLIPRAQKARDILPEKLRQQGALVDVLVTYRTVRPSVDVDALRQALATAKVDAITFTSASTVTNFASVFQPGEAARLVHRAGVAVACIGPVTVAAAVAAGLTVQVQADQFTVEHLVAALERYFTAR